MSTAVHAQRNTGTHWDGLPPEWVPPANTDWLHRLLDLLAEPVRADEELVDLPLGEWWDAVVTFAGPAGGRLLNAMDQIQPGGCGPVICDLGSGWLMWLTPTGSEQQPRVPNIGRQGAPL